MEDSRQSLRLSPQSGGDTGEITVSGPSFTVGRATGNDLQIHARDVSSRHAMICRSDAGVWTVEDLQSTNGTFINGKQVDAPAELQSGDLVHFAAYSYRIIDDNPGDDQDSKTVIAAAASSIKGNLELVEVIEKKQVYSHFQPIFDAQTKQPVAWEALGRGVAGGERMPPGKMFGLADLYNRNYELSQNLRDAAIDCVTCGHCWKADAPLEIWINLHPEEVVHPSFEEDILELASRSADAKFAAVIEAPETWVNQTEEMQNLVSRVRAVGLRVAYDDFGAGQSRLPDLMQVPPDYLKFDRALITNLHDDPVKRDLLWAMVRACDSLNVTTLAEGVETEEEYNACLELGIRLFQGYYLERPAPACELFAQEPASLPADCQHIRLGSL